MSFSGQVPIDTNQKRLGRFWLMPRITPVNAVTYFFAGFVGISMMAFLSFVQPLALKLAGIERAIQGTVTGDLAFYQECLVLLMTPFVGAAADKFGRRPLMMAGYIFLATGYGLYPYADSLTMLYVYRFFFACGVAHVATLMAIISADYVQEGCRGKWTAFASFIQGSGVLLFSQLVRWIPARLEIQGWTEADIAKLLFWSVMGICLFAFVILRLGLSSHKPPETRERDSFSELIAAGLRAARENARIALSYGAAFAARGDVLIVGLFLFLWTQHAAEDLGLSMGAAFRRGGMLMLVIQGSAMLWALCQMLFLDRLDRVTGVIIAFTLAAIGYSSFGFVDDPFDNSAIIPAIVLGMGESSTMIAGNALAGQSAPTAIRGAVLGMCAVSGAMGILLATMIGGRLFDNWMPGGPYVQMGIINGIILIWAIYVRFNAGAAGPSKSQ